MTSPSPDTLVIPEWGRRRVRLTPAAVQQLIAASQRALRVEATEAIGEYDLIANSYVGTIVTPDVRVVIRPKAGFGNLLYLLGIGIDDIDWWRSHFPYDSNQELLPAVLAFFARATRRALQAGLLRRYRGREESLTTIRGRIDIAAMIRQHGQLHPVPCTYEDFTADNNLNRYLRGAVRAALGWAGVPASVRQLLLAELLRLDGVADTRPRVDALDRHHYTRLDRHYETPLRLARLVLSRGTLVQHAGATGANAFLIDMNRLFETFVAASLSRRLTRLDLHPEPWHHFDSARNVRLRPDLEFRRRGRAAYVADVKYKLNDDGIARNPDYYQLLAYTSALQVPEGLLIYCLDGGSQPPRVIHPIGAGKRLGTYLLDVTGDLQQLEAALDDLAAYVTERAEMAEQSAA